MGACDISFELDGKKTFADVLKEFKRLRAINAEENGHAHGYSGDWQTIDTIKDHSGTKVFKDGNEAFEYCMSKSEKWSYAIAVKYEVRGAIKLDAKMKRLQNKLSKLQNKYNEFVNLCHPIRQFIYEAIKTNSFHTCQSCKSRVNTIYFKRVSCPVCSCDIIPNRHIKRLEYFTMKINNLKNEITAYMNILENKSKVIKTQWMVAGWAAC